MTGEPINLTALRTYAEEDYRIKGADVLALIGAVEAARALTLTGYIPPPRLYAEVDALHEALERFTP